MPVACTLPPKIFTYQNCCIVNTCSPNPIPSGTPPGGWGSFSKNRQSTKTRKSTPPEIWRGPGGWMWRVGPVQRGFGKHVRNKNNPHPIEMHNSSSPEQFCKVEWRTAVSHHSTCPTSQVEMINFLKTFLLRHTTVTNAWYSSRSLSLSLSRDHYFFIITTPEDFFFFFCYSLDYRSSRYVRFVCLSLHCYN